MFIPNIGSHSYVEVMSVKYDVFNMYKRNIRLKRKAEGECRMSRLSLTFPLH